MEKLLSTGEVSRLLGIPVHRIAYAHSVFQVPEPACRILNKRMYSANDVRRIADHFGVTLPADFSFEDAEKEAQ